MTTGKPKTRLSEKLNEELEQIRAEHAALIESSLESFRIDLLENAKNVRDIIEGDTSTFLDWTGRSWQAHIDKIRLLLKLSPWIAVSAATVLILITLGLTFLVSWAIADLNMDRQMRAFGLQQVENNGTTFLVLDPAVMKLQSCTLSGRPVTCLTLEAP